MWQGSVKGSKEKKKKGEELVSTAGDHRRRCKGFMTAFKSLRIVFGWMCLPLFLSWGYVHSFHWLLKGICNLNIEEMLGEHFPLFFMAEHCGGRPAHCLIFMGLVSWHSQLIFAKWMWPCSWLLSVNLGFFPQEMQSAKDDVTEMKRNFGIYGRKIIWDSKSVFPFHGDGTTESFFF